MSEKQNVANDDWSNLGFDAYFEDDEDTVFFAGAFEGMGYRDFRKG